MLKLYLKYTSEAARRTKDKDVAVRLEKAFGRTVNARKRKKSNAGTDEDVAEEM
jgi:hypothetical protein